MESTVSMCSLPVMGELQPDQTPELPLHVQCSVISSCCIIYAGNPFHLSAFVNNNLFVYITVKWDCFSPRKAFSIIIYKPPFSAYLMVVDIIHVQELSI